MEVWQCESLAVWKLGSVDLGLTFTLPNFHTAELPHFQTSTLQLDVIIICEQISDDAFCALLPEVKARNCKFATSFHR